MKVGLLDRPRDPRRAHRAHRPPAPRLGPADPERGDRPQGRRRDGRGGARGRAGSPRGRTDRRGDRAAQGAPPPCPGWRRACAADLGAARLPTPTMTPVRPHPRADPRHEGGSPYSRRKRHPPRIARLTLPSRLPTGTTRPSMPTGRKTPALRIVSFAIALLVAALALVAWPTHGRAVEAVRVNPQLRAIDLTPMVERYRSNGDEIRILTAPGRDGIVRGIAVKAREAGTRPDWIVFALTNDTDEQVDRLLVAPHFRLTASGVIWPDLGSSRIAAITASEGIRPEREDSPDADAFLITLDPGTTVTFVAELNSENLPQVYLWEADAYKERVNGLTLYKGIIIGIAGLLALFLTIVFVVKGALIFPAAAALAWAVLAYSCIDFGFFQRIFPIGETAERDLPGRRRGRARRDAPRLPVRLSEPEPLARALQPRHRLLARLPRRPRRPRRRRSAGGVRRRPHVDRRRRRDRLRARHPSRDPRLRPRRHAGADLAPADRLGDGGRLHGRRPAVERPRAAGPDRRPRADRHADRLHGDAARLRGRRLHAGPRSATPSGARSRSRARATSCSTGTSSRTGSSSARRSSSSSG